MIVVIAGGRDRRISSEGRSHLDAFLRYNAPINLVVTGGCHGIDSDAEAWARSRRIHVATIRADWDAHGASAGPKRNAVMAKIADAVILFPGGKGTESMAKEAAKAKILIYDWRASLDHAPEVWGVTADFPGTSIKPEGGCD